MCEGGSLAHSFGLTWHGPAPYGPARPPMAWPGRNSANSTTQLGVLYAASAAHPLLLYETYTGDAHMVEFWVLGGTPPDIWVLGTPPRYLGIWVWVRYLGWVITLPAFLLFHRIHQKSDIFDILPRRFAPHTVL